MPNNGFSAGLKQWARCSKTGGALSGARAGRVASDDPNALPGGPEAARRVADFLDFVKPAGKVRIDSVVFNTPLEAARE